MPKFRKKPVVIGGAVRAARRAGDEAGLWVHVLDGDTPPRAIRTYPPRRQGGAR